MTDRSVRIAVPGDIEPLRILVPAACAEAYGGSRRRPDAFAKHPATCGPGYFADLPARPAALSWVGEADATVMGFAVLLPGTLDLVEQRPGAAGLSRLYLLEAATARPRRDGATHLWLEAMEAAGRAPRAHERRGFRTIGRTRFGKPAGQGCAAWSS